MHSDQAPVLAARTEAIGDLRSCGRCSRTSALLIDLDGVRYVEDQPISGAVEAVNRLREHHLALRFVTNTTAHSRDRTLRNLAGLGSRVDDRELITPAALAVGYCRERRHGRVALIMNEEVKRDFKKLEETTGRADAVIIGDLGSAFGYDVLNHAFRQVMEGAELIALQKNRYRMRADGPSLDGGPFVAAIESDIGGGLRAGIEAILVRTGKYREDRVRESDIQVALQSRRHERPRDRIHVKPTSGDGGAGPVRLLAAG